MPNEASFAVHGSSVKALGGGKVAGWLVLFSTSSDPDLAGDFFDAATDYDMETSAAKASTVYWQHGLDPTLKKRKLGSGEMTIKDAGVWFEAQLNMRDEYEKAIYDLATQGKLGWSSGTVGHLVERTQVGKSWHVDCWPLGGDASLTPTPCEPRIVAEIKSLAGPTLAELKSGMMESDRRRILERAVREATFGASSWVENYDDDTVISAVWMAEQCEYLQFPYSMVNGAVTLGQPIEVKPTLVYQPCTEAEGQSMPLKFYDRYGSALAAVKAVTKDAERIKALRESDGRKLSDVNLARIEALAAETEGLSKSLRDLSVPAPTLATEEEQDACRKAIARMIAERSGLIPTTR